MTFFRNRYGVLVPEFSLYVSPDPEAVAARYTDLTGREPPLFTQGWEGGTVTDTPEAGLLAFVAGQFVSEGDRSLSFVIAHEYYHLVQHDILRSAGVIATVPRWLVEGTAQYGEDIYKEHKVVFDARRTWINTSLISSPSFTEIANEFGQQHYEVGALAIDWLVNHSGEPDSHVEYWRVLAEGSSPQDAFESVFGLTIDNFVEAFDEYRSELASSTPHISGVVLDLEGSPLRGVYVSARSPGNHGSLIVGTTDEDGRFSLEATDGEYYITVGRVVGPSADGTTPRVYFDYSYNSETGYANTCSHWASRVLVEGVDVTGIEIKVLPALLGLPDRPLCNEGVPGHHTINVRVLGPDGEPLPFDGKSGELMLISAYYNPTRPAAQGGGRLNPDGTTRIIVGDGYSYILTVGYLAELQKTIGWYGEGGFTSVSWDATAIEIDGADVTGIEIRLPDHPADLPRVR